MKVLGIDCGIAITGWAIIEKKKRAGKYNVVDYGVIRTKSGLSMQSRLKKLFDDLNKIMKKHQPDKIAIEELFYFKNQKTIISVGQARGVTVLACEENGREVVGYTPLQVKQAVTGYGNAKKKQVQRMVKTILSLKKLPKPDDAADALAIAICHLNTAI